MGASVPPLHKLYEKGRTDPSEFRLHGWDSFGLPEEPSIWSPWTVFLSIAVLAWGSFCVGMWVGQIETLARVNAVERVEAER